MNAYEFLCVFVKLMRVEKCVNLCHVKLIRPAGFCSRCYCCSFLIWQMLDRHLFICSPSAKIICFCLIIFCIINTNVYERRDSIRMNGLANAAMQLTCMVSAGMWLRVNVGVGSEATRGSRWIWILCEKSHLLYIAVQNKNNLSHPPQVTCTM